MPISRFRACAACLLVAGFLIAVLPPVARGSTVVVPSFSELVKNADTIVSGVVEKQAARWEIGEGGAPAIFTTVTVRVSQHFKGPEMPKLELKIAGGLVDGIQDEVQGAPEFQTGKSYLLFVQNNGKQLVPLVALTYGQFKIIRDAGGVDRLFRPDDSPITSMDEIDADAGKITGERATAKNRSTSGPKAVPLGANVLGAEIHRVVKEQKSGR